MIREMEEIMSSIVLLVFVSNIQIVVEALHYIIMDDGTRSRENVFVYKIILGYARIFLIKYKKRVNKSKDVTFFVCKQPCGVGNIRKKTSTKLKNSLVNKYFKYTSQILNFTIKI